MDTSSCRDRMFPFARAVADRPIRLGYVFIRQLVLCRVRPGAKRDVVHRQDPQQRPSRSTTGSRRTRSLRMVFSAQWTSSSAVQVNSFGKVTSFGSMTSRTSTSDGFQVARSERDRNVPVRDHAHHVAALADHRKESAARSSPSLRWLQHRLRVQAAESRLLGHDFSNFHVSLLFTLPRQTRVQAACQFNGALVGNVQVTG